jgi:hypothetical protein
MPDAVCTNAFSQGAYAAGVGDIVSTTSDLYVRYPSYFTSTDQTFVGTYGPVLSSSGGSLYRVVVNDGGTLSTQAV